MRCATQKKVTVLWTALLLGASSFLLPQFVLAQRPVLEGAVSTGSGMSFGQGDGHTVVLQSPMYIDVDIIYANDERPKIEYVVGFQAELQGRVSAGVVPQLRFTTGPAVWMVYGLIGCPVVFAPFVMVGAEAGGGFLWRFVPRFGAFAEIVLDLYFLGNDVAEGAMVQLDANVGIRLLF